MDTLKKRKRIKRTYERVLLRHNSQEQPKSIKSADQE
jgi:hypothetical protein